MTNAKQAVDLRGIPCPLNFVQVKLALEKIGKGEQIAFFLDAGEVTSNIKISLIRAGHTVLQLTPESTYTKLLVEKH